MDVYSLSQEDILVIGHRCPDTDSICSALAYAALKQASGVGAVAARAGEINKETAFALAHFDVPPPVPMPDVRPRVGDIMAQRVVCAHPWQTLRQLGEIMRQESVRAIPVVDEERRLAGIITAGDMARRYFDEMTLADLHSAGLSFDNIRQALGGTVLCGENLSRTVPGRVLVGATDVPTMTALLKPGDLLLVGNRLQAQLAALAAGVCGLIITNGAGIAAPVLQQAQDSGAVIIGTHHDTYRAARLLNLSVPVGAVMRRQVTAFKPEEGIADVLPVMTATKYRIFPVVEDGRLVGTLSRAGVLAARRRRVILVDHNELSQAAAGMEEAEIVEIIDHHRLGGLLTGHPIFVYQEPVGSTATIVAELYRRQGLAPPRSMAGLLMAAIISDTVLFKSPTCTTADRNTARQLAVVAGVDLTAFGSAMLQAGAATEDMTAEQILHADLKEFSLTRWRVAVGQINTCCSSDLLAREKELREAMTALCARKDYDLVLLMVTDILAEDTTLLLEGPQQDLVAEAFGTPPQEGRLLLPGVLSRKKQVVPPLIAAGERLAATAAAPRP